MVALGTGALGGAPRQKTGGVGSQFEERQGDGWVVRFVSLSLSYLSIYLSIYRYRYGYRYIDI